MRSRLTLVLLLLNVLVLGCIYYLESGNRGSDPFSRHADIIPEGSEIVRLAIQRRDGPEIVLEKRGLLWHLAAPFDWPANDFAVQRILTQLQFMEKEVSFSLEGSGQTLKDYGLAQPPLVLHVTTQEGEIALKIGDATGVGQRVYLLHPRTQEVLVAGRELVESLDVDMESLRSQEIFNLPVFEVRGLAFKAKVTDATNLTVRVVRDNQQWKFETPIVAEASTPRVEQAIQFLTATRIVRFFAPGEVDDAETGLESPNFRLTLRGNNRQQDLLIGAEVPDASALRLPEEDGATFYYARVENSPTVFAVPGMLFEYLRVGWEALRERQFMRFDVQRTDAVEIEQSGRAVRLQKLETGAWQVMEKKAGKTLAPLPADAQTVARLLDSLSRLEAWRFVSDAPSGADLERFGFADPQRLIRISGQTPLVLLLGEYDANEKIIYTKLEGANSIYGISPALLRDTQVNALHYRDRVLHVLPDAARIISLEVRDLREEAPLFALTLEDLEKGWGASMQGMDEAVARAVLRLVASIRRLEVASYLSSAFTEDLHLDDQTPVPWRYAVRARVLLPGGGGNTERTYVLFFTERLGGTMLLGGSPELDSVFTVSRELAEAMQVFTFDRESPPEHAPDYVPPPLEAGEAQEAAVSSE